MSERQIPAAFAKPNPGIGGVFGRRVGRRLRITQSGLMDRLLPVLDIDLTRPFDRDGLFAGAGDIWLEIGFGGGEHLASEAERRPDVGFIGCEPFRNGVAKLLQQAAENGSTNIRVRFGDALPLINWLPEGLLGRVDLLYPDPWPKRRQRKRRFISDETLARLARAMRPHAELRFATDIDDYAGWTLARIARSKHFDWPAEAAGDWRHPWTGWKPTRYENKAVREGRDPAYFTFVRR